MRNATINRSSGKPSNRPAGGRPEAKPRFQLPDGSRSAQSPWVWRAFLFLSLVAFGLALSFLSEGRTGLAVAWLVITIGWFAISMWIWRRNVLFYREQAAPEPRRR